MKSTYRTLWSASLLAVPVVLSAQSTPTRDSAKVLIDPVIVTANPLPTALSSVTQAVTVLDGDDLRARGVTTVGLALREAPGAITVQTGSYGAATSLFLRGGESRYTKVLVDGTPINEVGGNVYLENLSTDNIDRIEIVRGPMSALYGADAVSGVVQIFTRRGTPGTQVFDGSVRAGTYGTWEGNAAVRGGNALSTYSLSGGLHRTSGVYSFNNNYFLGTLSGAFTMTPDDATSIALTSGYTNGQFHYPTDYSYVVSDTNAYNTEHRFNASVNATRTVTPWLTLRLIGADTDVRSSNEDLSTFGSGSAASNTRTQSPGSGYRRQGDVQATMLAGLFGTWTFGAQYQKEYQHLLNRTIAWTGSNVGAATVFESVDEGARITRGYYAAVQGAPVSHVTYNAGVRYDDHDDFKKYTTYHGGVRISLVKGLAIRASYGTAFNAPSLSATLGSPYNDGNPNLSPEIAHSLDGAIEQLLWNGRVRASVGAFDQHFSQMLQYVAGLNSGPPNYTPITPSYYQNLTSVHAKGYEGELHLLLLDGLTADVTYSQTISKVFAVDPTYTGPLTPGQSLTRRPSHSGTANVVYNRLGVGSIGATASYYGKRSDVDYAQSTMPTVTLPAYVRLDLSASVDVLKGQTGPKVAITGRVENALDKKYTDVVNYDTPGRAVFIGARVTAQR